MDTTQAVAAVLKTDALGRVQTPVTRREQLLDEFEKSGLSGKKFAALIGIKYQTFATWAQKRRRSRGTSAKASAKIPAKTAEPVRWLEAVVQEAQQAGGSGKPIVVLELRGGARLEIANAKQAELAAALLRALEPMASAC